MAKKKKIKIPKSVLDLRMSPKKFAKKHDIRLKGKMSKKEKKHKLKKLNTAYAEAAISGLNKAVKILAENLKDDSGKKINKVKDGVENVIIQPDVIKRVAKIYRKNPEMYPNMIYLPFMIMNTLTYYASEQISEEEKEIGKSLDTEGLVLFCEKILKKQIKRYKSAGLDATVAYQLATCIPTTKLLRNNRDWYHRLIQQIYDIAAETDIDVDLVLKSVSKIDKGKSIDKKDFLEGFFSEFIMRKSSNKSLNYTDSQKEVNEVLIDRTLKYLDSLKSRKLKEILKTYIKRRKIAESYKKDTKRVIKFTDHANSNSPYEKIKAVVQELIDDNSSNELYLS